MAARRMSDAQLDHEVEALRRILVAEVPVSAESEARFRRAIQDEIRRRERNREWWGAAASAAMASIVTAGIYSTAFTLAGLLIALPLVLLYAGGVQLLFSYLADEGSAGTRRAGGGAVP